MNSIDLLIKNYNNTRCLTEITKNQIGTSSRYEYETCILRFIILDQLNSPKNRKKGKFEENSMEQLFCLLLEEVYEIRDEIETVDVKLDVRRTLEEIGDAGAYLVGLISKLIEIMKNED